MTLIKICGITNLEDARLSVEFGADALGFNFYPKSPRFIEPERAREIIARLPDEVLKIGVFVNEKLERVVEVAGIATLGGIQLHGDETPDFARELKSRTGLEIIKAFGVSADFQVEDVLKFDVDAILLDAYNPSERGGTGEVFDWEIARNVRVRCPKLYLAGGLGPGNVADAIKKVVPYAVDACSRLELRRGIKDARLVKEFCGEVDK